MQLSSRRIRPPQRPRSRYSSLTLLLLAFDRFPSSQAFWRLPCQAAPLVVERADPLTNPGGISQHVHAIHGGSNFNLDMGYDDTRKSDCASCIVKQDLSNYWTPQLYFWWKNGSFTSVGGGNLLIYYMQHSHPSDEYPVQAFPEGFRMLVGNPYTRSYDSTSAMAKGIGWNCLGGEGLKKGETKNPWFPTVNCADSLRAEIMFPSCWDGENTDSSNHISHMAFPEDGELGACPSSHPKRLITIFYEVWWATAPFKDSWGEAMNSSQPFVLATGDPLGYGLHGDFLNGWDIDILQQATDECTSDTGEIERCTIFDFNKYDQFDPNSCIQSPSIIEQTLGTLDILPGCNPVDYGPGDVTVCNEETIPVIEDEVTVSGYLVEGEKKLKVKKSGSGGGSGSTEEGEEEGGQDGDTREGNEEEAVKEETEETDSADSTASKSDSSPEPTSKDKIDSTPATSSFSPKSTSTPSSKSQTTSNETSSDLSSTFERNKALFLCLIFVLPVLLFVTIVLCCKFSCGRGRKQTLAREYEEDKALAREERALRRDTTESETSESESEDARSRRRRF